MFYEFEASNARLGLELPSIQQLAFEGGEKALAYGFVKTIAD